MAYHRQQAILEAIRVLLSHYVDTPTLLLKCRGVHTDVSRIVRDEIRRRYSVFFRTIVNDTVSFLDLMRTGGAILAGGAAFAFLTDTPSLFAWPFYVDAPHYDSFKDYLIQREGYEQHGDEVLNADPNPDFCDVEPGSVLAGVQRLVVLAKGDVLITVSSCGSPLFPPCSSVPIAYQDLTFIFNYLAADGFCCAYPSLTLRHRTLFHLEQMGSARFMDMLAQYADHNLHFRTHPDNWDHDAAGLPRPCALPGYEAVVLPAHLIPPLHLASTRVDALTRKSPMGQSADVHGVTVPACTLALTDHLRYPHDDREGLRHARSSPTTSDTHTMTAWGSRMHANPGQAPPTDTPESSISRADVQRPRPSSRRHARPRQPPPTRLIPPSRPSTPR
ncbi:hypothetical protein C8Q76DRAFT_804138 [Earliella scabrosa]|nr:hypothetical protein C8Q76DRAFT_804138 [Earliella scabrosa]